MRIGLDALLLSRLQLVLDVGVVQLVLKRDASSSPELMIVSTSSQGGALFAGLRLDLGLGLNAPR